MLLDSVPLAELSCVPSGAFLPLRGKMSSRRKVRDLSYLVIGYADVPRAVAEAPKRPSTKPWSPFQSRRRGKGRLSRRTPRMALINPASRTNQRFTLARYHARHMPTLPSATHVDLRPVFPGAGSHLLGQQSASHLPRARCRTANFLNARSPGSLMTGIRLNDLYQKTALNFPVAHLTESARGVRMNT